MLWSLRVETKLHAPVDVQDNPLLQKFEETKQKLKETKQKYILLHVAAILCATELHALGQYMALALSKASTSCALT